MVNRDDTLDDLFFALAHGIRREMVSRLARGPMTVSELAQPFEVSAPAITKHLKVLERAGLIRRQHQGRVHHCNFECEAMAPAALWIERHKASPSPQHDALEGFLAQVQRAVAENEE